MLTHLSVHQEGEIDRRRALGQALHVTARREHEDLVLIEVDLQELEKLLRTVRILLELDELAEPRQMVIELVGTLAVLLVQPVRGDTVLRRAVHVARADLDLVQLSGRPEHRGVQGLITVRLGARDVVLDPLLQRRPRVVDDPQHVVAVGDAVDEYAYRQQVVNLVERLAPLLHLLEDGPQVLGPADNLPARDPGAAQLVGQRRAHPLDGPVPLHPLRLDVPRQLFVVVRLEILERQILELRLHAGHAEAMRQRRVQLARLQRNALALLRRQRIERAHVVQPVGELDDDHARVPRDRHRQFGCEDGDRTRHNSPASAKLTYRSPPITTWSYTGTSSTRPASTNWRVTARSSAEGVGSPLG